MSTFDVREIFTFAMAIEDNGYRFYTKMAEKFDSEGVKNLFTYLAEEEVRHKRTFEKMLATLQDHQPAPTAPTDYIEYLRAYTGTSVFQPDTAEEDMQKITNISDALNYSIERESDSILYYHEIKNFVPASEHRIIDNIIQEEHKHYVRLSELAKVIK